MKIGVIGGCGVVGSAVSEGLKNIGHDVAIHDILLETSMDDVLDTAVCFICVPSPSERTTGRCDTSIVESVVSSLKDLGYSGIICIKSTVEPGTTRRLAKKYSLNNMCFVPEFLRERCALQDFLENHDTCIIGTDDKEIYDVIVDVHGDLPRSYSMVSLEEAEICKYFNNIYNATLITLANSFYEVCKAIGADYTKVKSALVKRGHIQDSYLDCSASQRGFGGMCLPKDTKAIAHVCQSLDLDVGLFEFIIEENNKYPVTVFNGMRSENE